MRAAFPAGLSGAACANLISARSPSPVVVTFAFGLAYIVSFIVSIPDFNNTTGGPFALSYNPAAQIFWDVFETRYGNGRLCNGLWIIPLIGAAASRSDARRCVLTHPAPLVPPLSPVPVHRVVGDFQQPHAVRLRP